MADNLDPEANIYEGVWRDWTKDGLQGLVWTLSQNKANLLSNILTLFIALVGSQLWAIIRFALHQSRQAKKLNRTDFAQPFDDIRLQQQVVLRNASSDLHTLKLMVRLAWDNRSTARNPFSYPLTIAALAILHYALFISAQTFMNTIVSTSSIVLVRSPHCGFWTSQWLETQGRSFSINGSTLETVRKTQDASSKSDHDIQQSLEYSQQCYSTNPGFTRQSSSCETMKRHHLDFELEHTTGVCPFGRDMCHEQQDSVIFTSQAIDSQHDLGINSPEGDRVSYRQRTTCAVLNDTNRIIETAIGTRDESAVADYGISIQQFSNFTYEWSNFSSLYTDFLPQTAIPYHVNTQRAWSPGSLAEKASTFTPDPSLSWNSSYLMLLFLSFTGRYFTPIDDPWFSAHQLHVKDVQAPFARNQWGRDRMISTLACKEQHQYCNTDGNCTAYLGWEAAQEAFKASTPRQQMIFDQLTLAGGGGIGQITISLARSTNPVLAMDQCATQSTVMSLDLPDDQWKLELKRWYSISLAHFQRGVVQLATGQRANDPATQLRPPETDAEKWFCDNVMIPSKVYQSFSLLAVLLIVFLGLLIVLVACSLQNIAALVQLLSRKSAATSSSWEEQNMMKLFGFDEKKPVPPPKDNSMLKSRPTPIGVEFSMDPGISHSDLHPEPPPRYNSFDSRASTLQHEAGPSKQEVPYPQHVTWLDRPLQDNTAVLVAPMTPRQVFETWRNERRSKRYGFQV